MNNKTFFGIVVFCVLIVALVPRSTGCLYNCGEEHWGYTIGTFNAYKLGELHKTSKGIAYDPSGMNISPELIDRLTDEVEECIAKTYPGGAISKDLQVSAQCWGSSFFPIDRSSFVVKIVSDWEYSCDKTQQVLPVDAPEIGCFAKGQTPTEQCPCRWRAGIECPNILITTPSLYLYKDVLVRFLGTCADPWNTPVLAKCVEPTTTPLNDGSDPNNGLQ